VVVLLLYIYLPSIVCHLYDFAINKMPLELCNGMFTRIINN